MKKMHMKMSDSVCNDLQSDCMIRSKKCIQNDHKSQDMGAENVYIYRISYSSVNIPESVHFFSPKITIINAMLILFNSSKQEVN